MLNFFLKTVVVFLAVFALLRFAPSIPVSSTVSQKQEMFTVSGTGKVTVIPDTGLVDLGVNISRSNVKQAQQEANNITSKIISELQKLGIDNKDIKTTNYSIYPNYDFRDGTNRIVSYNVNSQLSIKVRDLEKLNDVVDRATNAGANTVSNIQLTVDEQKQKDLLSEARTQAIDEAKKKATDLAKAAGITLGKIVNVQESSQDRYFQPLANYKMSADMGAGGGETQIQPGSTNITSSVTLTYETR